MTWTKFHDMHSGGDQKLDWPFIFIEAPLQEAKAVFYHRFGRNPDRITCTCCGEDYSISESEDLAQASAYQRNCRYDNDTKHYVEELSDRPMGGGTYEIRTMTGTDETKTEYLNVGPDPYVTVEDFFKTGTGGSVEHYIPLAIYAKDIKDEERAADLPEEGYVWVD